MSKILLVGNGLTSNLISDYENLKMMSLIKDKESEIYEKANQLFSKFRQKVNTIEYSKVAFGYCGDDLYCGETGFNGPITGLPFNEKLLKYVKLVLVSYGFDDYENACMEYFQTYGLVYETQQNEISSVESLLKIVHLFRNINQFDENDYNKIIRAANKIYYNNGKCSSINLDASIQTNLRKWLNEYEMVFTTNYDCLLDDASSRNNHVLHLHGGFYFKDKYTKSEILLDGNEAYLIWGINGDDKRKKMSGGTEFSTTFPLEIPLSLFDLYLDKLRTVSADEIDIFGYSGENDQHINKTLSQNRNIKQIYYFCNPKGTHKEKETFKIRQLFFIPSDKSLSLCSWDLIWNKLH